MFSASAHVGFDVSRNSKIHHSGDSFNNGHGHLVKTQQGMTKLNLHGMSRFLTTIASSNSTILLRPLFSGHRGSFYAKIVAPKMLVFDKDLSSREF